MRLLAFTLQLACTAAVPVFGAELTGRVTSESGAPVAGADVYVYTAAPRFGTSPFCPSCYPDCGKRVRTAKDGTYVLRHLGDSLLFRILVVRDRWEPAFFERVDPLAGTRDLTIQRRRARKLDPARTIRGQVLDPNGRPVVGATVTPSGFSRGVMGAEGYFARFGALQGDPLCITDERGRFTLAMADSGVKWFVRIRARDLAAKLVHAASDDHHVRRSR